MDVISLGKAKKAKQAIEETQDQLGYGGSEQGLDIRDKFKNADERLTALEEKDPKVELNNRVAKVSEHTMINLNKHNLRVSSLMTQARYKMTDMIVDDFEDDSGIDYEESVNIFYDGERKVVQALDAEQKAQLVTISEPVESLNAFALSVLYGVDAISTNEVALHEGVFHQAIHQVDVGVTLAYQDGYYALEGVYETNPIYLSDHVKKIHDISYQVNAPEETSFVVEYAFSQDGESFGNYSSTISATASYVKIRVSLQASIKISPVQLSFKQEDDHSMFDSGSLQLRIIGGGNKLVRNLQQYTPLEYSKEQIQFYDNKVYRLQRNIEKGWNR